MESLKNKKYIIIMLFAVLIVITIGLSYAFYTYSKTGSNTISKAGNIDFSSTSTTFELTNAFPVSGSLDSNASGNVGTINLTIVGSTSYDSGIEYLIQTVDVDSTLEGIASLEVTSTNLGSKVNNRTYFRNRGGNTSMITDYKDVSDDGYAVVGYIAKGASGVNGTITIKAFIDKDKVAITDTPTTNTGWQNGRRVYTTGEWNNLTSKSFKIKVETHEGLWVDPYIGDVSIMGTFPTVISNQKASITEIIFMKDTMTNINTRYTAASTKADVSLNSDGSVLAWIESNKLYVGSDELIYLSTGYQLFNPFVTSNSSIITKIDLSNADTTMVTNMSGMFSNMTSLTNLTLGSYFTTYNVTNMNSMFNNCSSITSLNLNLFNTKYVEDMGLMFNGCSSLTTIDVSSNWSTESVLVSTNMFLGCTNLVGGSGTTYNASNVDMEYARIDDTTNSQPGYLS